MELNGNHRKWQAAGRRWQNLERILILFATMCAFSLMMIINIDVYRYGNTALWAGDLNMEQDSDNVILKSPIIRQMAMPAMKTIVAYSPEKQAELDRKMPIFCEQPPKRPKNVNKEEIWLDILETGVSVYAAYYDDRLPHQPFTRILAIANGSYFNESLYCQTWRRSEEEGDVFEAVEATVTQIWWEEWDPATSNTVTPLLISCALGSKVKHDYRTIISSNPCATGFENVLKVEINNNEKYERNFTVCVKDMTFDYDISQRLIEWFEVLRILGAEYFHIYVANLSDEILKILEYYSRKNVAKIHKAPRETASFLWQRRRDHLLAYNDCLYKNLKTSRYIIPLDIDEMIVPKNAKKWTDILDILKMFENEPPGAASLAVSNAFFFDSFNLYKRDIRSVPHVLTHLRRSSLTSPVPEYSKSFVSTSKALSVFNHYALSSLSGASRARAIPEDLALLHHYKSSCHPALVDCQLYTESSFVDDTLLRISNELVANINRVLNEI